MEYHEEATVSRPVVSDRALPMRVQPAVGGPQLSPQKLIEMVFARLDPVALGVSFAFVAGVGLFVATAILLLRGDAVVGPKLSLLGHYFIGFKASWAGAFVGLAEAGAAGFAVGYVLAKLRNWGLAAYASLLRRRAAAEARRNLLDQV